MAASQTECSTCGQSLSPDTLDQVIVVKGPRKCGKSKLINALIAANGKKAHASSAPGPDWRAKWLVPLKREGLDMYFEVAPDQREPFAQFCAEYNIKPTMTITMSPKV